MIFAVSNPINLHGNDDLSTFVSTKNQLNPIKCSSNRKPLSFRHFCKCQPRIPCFIGFFPEVFRLDGKNVSLIYFSSVKLLEFWKRNQQTINSTCMFECFYHQMMKFPNFETQKKKQKPQLSTTTSMCWWPLTMVTWQRIPCLLVGLFMGI